MMAIKFTLAVAVLLVTACNLNKPFHEVKTDNPDFFPNTAFAGYENLSSPKFEALKKKYQTDTIFHGETDELKRILLLRHWIRKNISINDIGPYPGNGSAESILDEGLKGNGFHCGHYMVVQNAIMNAYGYVTRCLGSGPGGIEGEDNHHGMNEIWLNSYHKWFLSDAKYDSHFEKNGTPLSALEVHDEYLKNKAADIVRVKGVDRKPVDFDEEYKTTKEHFARTYAYIEWDKYNTRYTQWPKDSSILVMFADDYFNKHKWIWDGKPHWAYNTPNMVLEPERKAIEWTPNVITSATIISGITAKIALSSNTPNLRNYQMKNDRNAQWTDIPDTVNVQLQADANEFIFRTVNAAGVTGPEHKVIIAKG